MDGTPFERQAMARALALAALGRRSTQPNPRVGCVIAQGDRIVGEGWHQRAGEPHAEVFALRQAGTAARGATAFVTLEPCNHHGRTPPCSEALIAAGVARVIYACGDPNPRVDGSGAARLRAAGVAVATGLLAVEGEELNVGFLSRMRRGRPWLRLKMAASLDGRTALAGGESRWITSPEARADVHAWRAESAAVLSSSATVLADDPGLTARPVPASDADAAGAADADATAAAPPLRQPLRVILDTHARVPATARLFAASGDIVRLVGPAARTPSAAPPSASGERAVHRIERITTDADGRLSLPAVLAWLGGEGINEVWTEAGPTLTCALLAAGLVDELVVYLAPRLLGPDARPLAHLPPFARLADAAPWRVQDMRPIGPDIRIMLRPES
ncbi:MAG: bifunctional diaminohydroxyphosphoribosylaminopyrimidine deaminase/5-amino-6-(5-phosphoribosylamino)uracil reductase RibD [Gammaproteobacteria bacterium]